MANGSLSLPELRELNEALRGQIKTDQVTGLYHEATAARIAKGLLAQNAVCTLLLLRVENLQRFKESQGCRKSDELMRHLAKMMVELFFGRDVLARVTESEFVVFSAGAAGTSYLTDKSRRIVCQAEESIPGLDTGEGLTLRTAVITTRKNDMFQTVLKRARRDLQRRQEMKHEAAQRQGERKPATEAMGLQENRSDAVIRSYKQLTGVYHILKCGLEQYGEKAFLLLLTVRSQGQKPLEPEAQRTVMKFSERILRKLCGSEDAYAAYSSCQYLLFMLGESIETVQAAVEQMRIELGQAAQEAGFGPVECHVRQVDQEGSHVDSGWAKGLIL